MTRTLDQVFRSSAARGPGRVAAEDPAREAHITYGDLDALSDALRDALLRRGVGPGDRVGIAAPKSIGTLASVLGILKAGAAYVPVDAAAPPQRNAYIFQDCSVKAIVVARPLAGPLRAACPLDLPVCDDLEAARPYGADLLLLAGKKPAAHQAAPPADLAYVLYTSGSTGKPKGVMHTHATALSFVDWCSEVFHPSPEDRFSSHAPFHFDLSILDLYVPFKHAATLVLLDEDLGKQPLRLAPLIAQRRISVWYSTPSILRLLVEFGRMERYDYSALRLVLFAGEVFPTRHLRALKAIWKGPRYFNLYGPTETNVCTFCEIDADIPPDRTEPYPIGKACSNDCLLVVDDEGGQVQPGHEGELLVRGGSVMQGYWNLPERTATAFFADLSGALWYRTGDVVKLVEDGNYLFLGRRDRMVKRRGNRVELGEIEAALYRHPKVSEAAVVALPDEQSGVSIMAFLTWAEEDKTPSLVELKRFCAENLPLYMVPDKFTVRASLPKTSTDKIDYQGLKDLAAWTSR